LPRCPPAFLLRVLTGLPFSDSVTVASLALISYHLSLDSSLKIRMALCLFHFRSLLVAKELFLDISFSPHRFSPFSGDILRDCFLVVASSCHFDQRTSSFFWISPFPEHLFPLKFGYSIGRRSCLSLAQKTVPPSVLSRFSFHPNPNWLISFRLFSVFVFLTSGSVPPFPRHTLICFQPIFSVCMVQSWQFRSWRFFSALDCPAMIAALFIKFFSSLSTFFPLFSLPYWPYQPSFSFFRNIALTDFAGVFYRVFLLGPRSYFSFL